jgi:hypothetical protein
VLCWRGATTCLRGAAKPRACLLKKQMHTEVASLFGDAKKNSKTRFQKDA